jgi:peptide chain release factor 2
VAVAAVNRRRASRGKINTRQSQSIIDNQKISIQQSAISNSLCPYNSTISFAGIRTSPAVHPTCGAIFDTPRTAEELSTIEQRVSDPDFWKDQASAQKLLQRRRRLEEDRDLSESLRRRADDLAVLVEWAEAGEPVAEDLAKGLDDLSTAVDAGETKKMLGGEHDRKNAIMTIHPGAGGTESQDWAEMLLRMYLRWSERRGFKRDIIDLQPGDEAGIKSATLTVFGDYAYGMLLAEAGVHRLVRISPFDQASRRHTSFASVFVWPELPEDVDVEIEEKDLRIDTYRSSGAGGQHVNVTDSAVRITHLPTGIVVSSQNERSQHRNRDSAMKVLKARLYDLKMKEQQAKLDQLGGEKKDIAFGSQIRSYVLHPYQMIKDHRTKEQVGDVNRVLDGDIDGFIKSYLMKKAAGTLVQGAVDED